MVIYKTTNLINGKFYIGQDSKNNPEYLGSGVYFKRAIKKYGRENFKKEILEYCETKEELNEREIYWIEKLNAIKEGYNFHKGGTGAKQDWVNKHDKSKLIRKKMSEGQQKRIRTIEEIEKFSKSRLGKKYGPRSESTKEKLSKWRSGKNYNEIMGEEKANKLKLKLSEKWKKNNPNNNRDLKGVNNPMFGKKHKNESKIKMSISAKARIPHNKGKTFQVYQFYKNNELIIEISGQDNAIKYCKEYNLPYSLLVKKFLEWNNWKCITTNNN